MTATDSYRYLGISDVFSHTRQRINLQETLSNLMTDTLKLINSQLSPDQIMRAIKTHVYLKFDYPLPP